MNKKRKMFFKMIIASLVRRRSRMMIALLAILVGTTTLSGLGTIYYDVPRQMSSQFRSYGANVIFTAADDSFITRAELADGISVFPETELVGYTGYRYENTKIHHMPVTLAGIDFGKVLKTSPYWLINGNLPGADGEILVGAKVAETLGIQVGDTVAAENSFEITDETETANLPEDEIYTDPESGERYCDYQMDFTVTAILETGGSEEEYAYISIPDMERLFLSERGYDIVDVSVASSQSQLNGYIEKINAAAGHLTAKPVKRVTASESTVLTKLQSLVFIVTAVVLALTMICVATTMAAVISERRREIGLRKALGASDASIIGQFMCEGLLLGAAGGALGSVLGYYFANFVSYHVFSSSIALRPMLIPMTVFASVAVTGLACLIPVKNTVNVDPAVVLKGE